MTHEGYDNGFGNFVASLDIISNAEPHRVPVCHITRLWRGIDWPLETIGIPVSESLRCAHDHIQASKGLPTQRHEEDGHPILALPDAIEAYSQLDRIEYGENDEHKADRHACVAELMSTLAKIIASARDDQDVSVHLFPLQRLLHDDTRKHNVTLTKADAKIAADRIIDSAHSTARRPNHRHTTATRYL